MKSDPNWKIKYQEEFDHALSARTKGNEGMARVCARRAVGILIGEYLTHRGYPNLGSSIYDRFSIFDGLPDIDAQTRQVVNHFLLTVDTTHNLPSDVDLLAEAQWLEKHLISDNHKDYANTDPDQ